jgi:hypothetical protein
MKDNISCCYSSVIENLYVGTIVSSNIDTKYMQDQLTNSFLSITSFKSISLLAFYVKIISGLIVS